MIKNSWNFNFFQRRDVLSLMSCLKIIGILRFFGVMIFLTPLLKNVDTLPKKICHYNINKFFVFRVFVAQNNWFLLAFTDTFKKTLKI